MSTNAMRAAAITFCLGLWVLLPGSPLAGREPAPKVLSTVTAVTSLTGKEAARGYRAVLDGVVTYSDPEWGLLFVQDQTGAIFIDVHGENTAIPPGSHIRLIATTAAGNVGAVLTKPKIQAMGAGVLPRPKPLSVAQLHAGEGDSAFVSTEGVLRPADENWERTCFRLFDGDSWATVVIPFRDKEAERLIGAKVRVSGVAGSRIDAKGKRVGAQLFVSRATNIQVEHPSPNDVHSPAQPVGTLSHTQAMGRFIGQIHVRGVVTWQRPGLFLLDDGTGAVRVRPGKNLSLEQGRTINVLGFPTYDEYGPTIDDVMVQKADIPLAIKTTPPLATTVTDVLKRALTNRQVRLRAHLVEQTMTPREHIFVLEEGGQRFHATLPRTASAEELVRLPKDAVLELNGLALIGSAAPDWRPTLLLLIASPAGVVVAEGVSWFTWERVVTTASVLGLLAIGSLAWITQLRRTVHKQTEIIRARFEREMQLESRYKRLFERNLAAVFRWRPDGTIVDCNIAFAQMLGVTTCEEVIGRSYWDWQIDGTEQRQVRKLGAGAGLTNRDVSLRRADGTKVCLLENISVVDTPEGTLYETIGIDVTQLRQNQADLQRAKDAAVHQALNDALTGLPNRRLLSDRLTYMLATARREQHQVALLYIDLDGFKLVNDSLGHATGDTLLIQVAARLQARVRASDTLARLGGDEFIIVLAGISTAREVTIVADDILRVLTEPFSIDDHEILIGASIGISLFPTDAQEPAELLQQADSAMYAAKRDGKNRAVFFTSDLGSTMRERLNLEHQLRRAIPRNEISVHYQPEFEVITGRLIRFEALARWNHPALGAISPGKFIPIAEESGLIVGLGAFILEQACHEAVQWQAASPTPIQLAVNVSGIQFRRENLVEEIIDILNRTGLPPELLQLELTESVMMADSALARETMQRLRAAGISLAIDDFGTGYSSLSTLQNTPVDSLKIDRSFIKDLGVRPGGNAMVQSVVSLAHEIGIRVIVEGVETAEQLGIIKALGGDEVQGYYLGYPTVSPRDVIPTSTPQASTFVAAVS